MKHIVPAKIAKHYIVSTYTNHNHLQRPRLDNYGNGSNTISWKYNHHAITQTEEKEEVRTMTRTEQIINKVNEIFKTRKDRSIWDKAVTADALDLFDQVVDGITEGWIDPDVIGNRTRMEDAMLNGANSWKHYSWSGCGLCYDVQIAKHYCTPSEYKRTRGGMYKPNKDEEWLDVQARALWQAARRVHEAIDVALFTIDLCPLEDVKPH